MLLWLDESSLNHCQSQYRCDMAEGKHTSWPDILRRGTNLLFACNHISVPMKLLLIHYFLCLNSPKT